MNHEYPGPNESNSSIMLGMVLVAAGSFMVGFAVAALIFH
jgi:hypothetical protein